jgi:hypothetical protein
MASAERGRALEDSGEDAGAAGEAGVVAFEVRYADDEPYSFVEGTRRRFGREDRDEDAITIWEQIHDQHLSKEAGELWCTDGQMWVRNLSQAHELVVDGSGSTALVLPARAPGHPGFACSVPWPAGRVRAPSTGSRQLDVTVLTREPVSLAAAAAEFSQGSVSNLPGPLQAVARAVCAPLLRGQDRPATAQEVAGLLGVSAAEATRRIDALCAHQLDQGHQDHPVHEVHRDCRDTSGDADGDASDVSDVGDPAARLARVARVARELMTSPLFATVRVEDVPPDYQEIAETWCAPLLAGGSLPASYAEIAATLDITARSARRRVEELTERYSAQVLALPGGLRAGETLGTATARLLVHRGKVRRT